MAYHFIHELTHTIRHNPMRAAFAAVLLIATTFYVCVGYQDYRVAEMGDVSTSAEVIDLTGDPVWGAEIETVVANEDDVPATTTRRGGHERYIDAHLTHAVAVEDDSTVEDRRRVEQVSDEAEQRASQNAPVWLLGVLHDH